MRELPDQLVLISAFGISAILSLTVVLQILLFKKPEGKKD
jgi:hypothetical protein